MSEAAAIAIPGSPPHAPPRLSYTAMVMRDTLARRGARIGAAWLGFLAFCAVFAPLLANTHPLLMKSSQGVISSPLLEFLTPADAVLFTAVVLLASFVLLRRCFWIHAAILAASLPLWIWLVTPPLTTNYDLYRKLESEGKLAWVIRAPISYSPTDRQRDRENVRLLAPQAGHILGTDENGSDVLSRIIHACRIALAVGFIATGISLVIGVLVGGLMGYFAGWVDLLGMRLVEIFESIPQLYLLLAFVAFFPRNLYIMMAIIGATGWTGYTRFIRAEFFKLRRQDFVHAAVACGLPVRSIIFRHMLPNGLAPVLVTASFGVASAILTESFLSFLGLGLIDEPSWGQMLSQAVSSSGGFSWWIATFPGLFIFLTVFAYNLVGESLRDAIDPHLRKSAHL